MTIEIFVDLPLEPQQVDIKIFDNKGSAVEHIKNRIRNYYHYDWDAEEEITDEISSFDKNGFINVGDEVYFEIRRIPTSI